MTKDAIDALKNINYSKLPRTQRGTYGERAAIRPVNPQDKADMKRLQDIDNDPNVIKWMIGEPMTSNELIEFATDHSEVMIYAISGSSALAPSERGEIQGWVTVRPDEKERIDYLKSIGYSIPDHANSVLEISYARNPKSQSGQMASGLRQVCFNIAKINSILPNASKYQPTTIVTAYVEPENEDSIRVLTHSGFIKVGSVLYDSDQQKPDDVYVLDWNLLNTMLEDKMDQAKNNDKSAK